MPTQTICRPRTTCNKLERSRLARPSRRCRTCFKEIFHLEPVPPGWQRQVRPVCCIDNEVFHIGQLQAGALAVPGHTPACMAYQVGDAVFVGDTLFMPTWAQRAATSPAATPTRCTSRCANCSARGMKPASSCYDSPRQGRAVVGKTTVADQRAKNIHVHDGMTEEAFVGGAQRDATLEMPVLILPSVQVNTRGEMLPPEANGVTYLRFPSTRCDTLPHLYQPYPLQERHYENSLRSVTAAKALVQEVPVDQADEAIRTADVLIVREADEYQAVHIPASDSRLARECWSSPPAAHLNSARVT